jgi:hypothetical protein
VALERPTLERLRLHKRDGAPAVCDGGGRKFELQEAGGGGGPELRASVWGAR